MNKILSIFLAIILQGCLAGADEKDHSEKNNPATQVESYKDGDIIFQSSKAGQSLAIQLATHSPYSHCGLIFKKDGKWQVLEAVQPVCWTPLQKWIDRGDDSFFVVKRLKDEKILTVEKQRNLKASAEKNLNKDYDLYFEWSDNKIYCSELVWKAYHEATGIELGKLQKLKEFDLSSEVVKAKMKERYGNNIPFEEKVISPVRIFDSELLEEVHIKTKN